MLMKATGEGFLILFKKPTNELRPNKQALEVFCSKTLYLFKGFHVNVKAAEVFPVEKSGDSRDLRPQELFTGRKMQICVLMKATQEELFIVFEEPGLSQASAQHLH